MAEEQPIDWTKGFIMQTRLLPGEGHEIIDARQGNDFEGKQAKARTARDASKAALATERAQVAEADARAAREALAQADAALLALPAEVLATLPEEVQERVKALRGGDAAEDAKLELG